MYDDLFHNWIETEERIQKENWDCAESPKALKVEVGCEALKLKEQVIQFQQQTKRT